MRKTKQKQTNKQNKQTNKHTKIEEQTRWIIFGKTQDCKKKKTNLNSSKKPPMLLALYDTRNMGNSL